MMSAAFRISFAVTLVCASVSGIGQSADDSDPVVDRIAKLSVFAFGGVGFTGAISPGEKDFRLILSHPSAEADSERLLRVGNPQAKCYALVGLWQLNPENSKAQAASAINAVLLNSAFVNPASDPEPGTEAKNARSVLCESFYSTPRH